ncbi:MAG: PQQ-binding-like beta-propeller repeat protein, partial [Planctomycetes bacterium]|nr:PQQ-binding-like beta-propeller repeat protein [Planctomycetota bacterium]
SIGSGVFFKGYVYRPNAGPGTIECVDPESGKVLWRNRGAGGTHWASLVMAGGLLYATGQSGTTVVFKPNPEEYEEVARNSLGDGCNATPAISNGQLFIRGATHLYCIGG